MITDYTLETVDSTRSPFAELVDEEAQHNPGPAEHNPGPAEHNPGPAEHNPGPAEHNPGPAECGIVTWYDDQGYLMDNSGRAKAVYFDRARRGAIDNGGGWQWTDATSIEDVVDRYLGSDDKEMSE